MNDYRVIQEFKNTFKSCTISIVFCLLLIAAVLHFTSNCNAEPSDFKKWGVNVPVYSAYQVIRIE